jgi:toxin HigB-1
MIKTFSDKETKALYETGKSKKLPSQILSRALRKLEYIDLATDVDDLKVPPGNKLHQLSGDRVGQYAIAINTQWRICFKFKSGDAFDVEVCDYHK